MQYIPESSLLLDTMISMLYHDSKFTAANTSSPAQNLTLFQHDLKVRRAKFISIFVGSI